MLELRPYQKEALEALENAVSEGGGNPCVVLPTGAGKSLVIAEAIRRWSEECPSFRCVVLAHRQELVSQNAYEFEQLTGNAPGIYSAGLGRRDLLSPVLFASIDSIAKKGLEIPPVDAIIVDEAHRIPERGDGKYRSFISDCKTINPYCVVIGFTATPVRLSCGNVCGPHFILNRICYEAHVEDLIRDGYLSKVRAKLSASVQPELDGVGKKGGEYATGELSEAMRRDGLVQRTVSDALRHIEEEKRGRCVWFCVDVRHSEEVAGAIRGRGFDVRCVTGHTDTRSRQMAIEDFRSGRVRHIVGCQVFCEGFNVREVDCVVLLRPTMSSGLYVQMVGRGMRLAAGKTDCLVLDYAGCIDRHGPIDCQDREEPDLYICPKCDECFPRSLRACPVCGEKIPAKTMEERDREREKERERKMHAEEVAQREILGRVPVTVDVASVDVAIHRKTGSDNPPTLQVTYRCGADGLTIVREWVALDHPGYAGSKARQWWARRFGLESAADMTVEKAAQDIFLPIELKNKTCRLTIRKDGKYWNIVDYDFSS